MKVRGGGVEELRAGLGWVRAVVGLDRVVHEPSRLAILTILRRRTAGADYLFILGLTGLSKGNLSNHLAKLEDAGLVKVRKHFEGKKPVTTVSLTEEGQTTIDGYWDKMEKISSESRRPSGPGARTSNVADATAGCGHRCAGRDVGGG